MKHLKSLKYETLQKVNPYEVLLEALSGHLGQRPRSLSVPPLALSVPTPPPNIWLGHRPPAVLFSAALRIRREYFNLKLSNSYFLKNILIVGIFWRKLLFRYFIFFFWEGCGPAALMGESPPGSLFNCIEANQLQKFYKIFWSTFKCSSSHLHTVRHREPLSWDTQLASCSNTWVPDQSMCLRSLRCTCKTGFLCRLWRTGTPPLMPWRVETCVGWTVSGEAS